MCFLSGWWFPCLQAACHRKGWRAWEAVLNENILPPGTNSPVCLHGQVNSHQQKKDEICFKKMCVDLSKAECCNTKVFRTSLATCPCKRNYPSWIDSMDYPIIRIIFTSPKKTSSLISTFSPTDHTMRLDEIATNPASALQHLLGGGKGTPRRLSKTVMESLEFLKSNMAKNKDSVRANPTPSIFPFRGVFNV